MIPSSSSEYRMTIAKQTVLTYAASFVSQNHDTCAGNDVLATRTAGLAMSGLGQYPKAHESCGGLLQ